MNFIFKLIFKDLKIASLLIILSTLPILQILEVEQRSVDGVVRAFRHPELPQIRLFSLLNTPQETVHPLHDERLVVLEHVLSKSIFQ